MNKWWNPSVAKATDDLILPSADINSLHDALFHVAATPGSFKRSVDFCRNAKNSHQIHFIGNGGSAAIASHMAADWMKNGGFNTRCYNDGAALTCLSNDLGYPQVFSAPLKLSAKDGDVLFAISSSGASESILNAVHIAHGVHMFVITLSGFNPSNPLRFQGDVNFYVPAHKYGVVEISHLTIIHMILDHLLEPGHAGR